MFMNFLNLEHLTTVKTLGRVIIGQNKTTNIITLVLTLIWSIVLTSLITDEPMLRLNIGFLESIVLLILMVLIKVGHTWYRYSKLVKYNK